ncbi:MAG: histidinol phosphate phosphatase, partial [Erysipelotrichaceae bacterium]|nr:histidinol phosphate phosphatase [Erysipelotrichaceae bacterium]
EYHVIPEDNTGVHTRYGHPDIGLSEKLREIFLEYDTGLLPASDAHVLQDIGKCIPDLLEYQE